MIYHYSPILQVCMNTHIRKAGFKNFQVLLGSRSSSKIVLGKLTSKIKKTRNNHVGNLSREVHDIKEGGRIFLPSRI